MYVKSVTLRGFKSFASATTLRLEPGITCIVGPNGSGKSNVVDALAWVMGEQGAKSLRGGKMEDVVFAGTHGRPPLGRAEVSMTIDNTDGVLPIDYSEVTLTRTMFRSGGSDYAINGTSCRLLDVQELLSDSGIGREMHVIVGQGQLDQVLRATPEERRGFIEEAAGVLKHRKRKERALRKLDTMEANLTRLADLMTEIRRQLGPLGRQAQTARRAVGIQAEVRDARLRILADDLAAATTALDDDVATEAALLQRRAECERALAQVNEMVAATERDSAEAAPAVLAAQETHYAAAALIERVKATHQVAAERVRLMRQEAQAASATASDGRDPERLKATADAVRGELELLQEREASAATALAEAQVAREAAEQAHAAA
ncbi:MAG: AAA family ATPase, partial [Ornithinimicrobium sp.]